MVRRVLGRGRRSCLPAPGVHQLARQFAILRPAGTSVGQGFRYLAVGGQVAGPETRGCNSCTVSLGWPVWGCALWGTRGSGSRCVGGRLPTARRTLTVFPSGKIPHSIIHRG